jgi:pimeloyl-ACP methyl ester carboxylesterase
MGEVVDTGLVPGETIVRPYAFIQGDATPDLRKILASDSVFKNPKMPRVVVEEISNPNTPEMNKIRKSMDRIVDSFHATLYNEPIGKLERSPIFAELYYNWVDELSESLDKNSIDKIIESIRTSAADYAGGPRKPERLVGEKTAGNPRHPVDIAAELKAPVLGLYGSADTGIPLESVDKMRQALAAAGSKNLAAKASRFEIYLDAPHAFHADYRETYRAGPAADGWVKCLDWFKRNGVA